tara:strand:- start:89 stop:1000 length:912 start_codon:yes stop_codon:yes gene_type:complete
MIEENNQGNPETAPAQKAAEAQVFGSSGDDFFDALENDVNSMVQDEDKPVTETEATPVTQGSNNVEEEANSVSQVSENENFKKRYSDSSREAQNLRAQLNELKPFIPVLDAMKQDSGLVEHVRNYFDGGGAVPGDIKQQLKLDEDFEFDTDEMVNNPDSKSRQVINTMVDGIVQKRANEILQREQAKAQEVNNKIALKNQADDFKKRHNMDDEQFSQFVREAQNRFSKNGLSFDDMFMLTNKGAVNQNVANATKQDMLNQMKTVRDIPVSQSSSNNAGTANNPNDSVFDTLLNSDGNIEELFS